MKNIFSTRQLRQLARADEGQALVLTAVGLVVLMLMAGLGVDVGFLRYEKQQMQKAADAGAIAGASALIYGGDYTDAARNDTSANGFANGKNGISVAVNNPPGSGPHSGDKKYVEVIVSQPQPTFFMRVGGFKSVAVRGRAVASAAASASGCIYVLDPKAPKSFMASGTISVAAACGIYVNSKDPNAYFDNGGACVQASNIGVAGGVEQTQGCSTTPTTGMLPVDDPMASVAAPAVGKIPQSCTAQNLSINGGTAVLNPGTYCGGIQIGGTSPNVTFNAGTYILYGGGLSINSSATVVGDGVTFYNTGAKNGPDGFKPISINGGAGITLSAPTSGPLEAMLFFEDRNPPKNGTIDNMITGASGSTFVGTLYFPTTSLTYAGNSTTDGYTTIVVNQLSFTGTSTVNDNYSSLSGGPPIVTATLVE